MHATRFRTTGLLIMAAITELFLGVSANLFTGQVQPAITAALAFPWGYLPTWLMAGGIILLILVRYPVPTLVRRVLVLLAALPLARVAQLAAGDGVGLASIPFATLGLAVTLAPWLPAHREGGWRLSYLTLGATQVLSGLQVLISPHALDGLVIPALREAAWLAGMAAIASGLVLVLAHPVGKRTRTIWVTLFCTAVPVLAALNAGLMGQGLGLVIWVGWALSLTASVWRLWRGDALLSEGEMPEAQADSPAGVERLLELWSWALPLMLLAVSHVGGRGAVPSPALISLFVLGISCYNSVLYLLLPHVGTPSRRILLHVIFLTISVAFLLTAGGNWGALSALIILPPFMAARIHGGRAGHYLLLLALGTVILYPLLRAWVVEHSLQPALGEIAVQALVIGTAGLLAIRSAAEQRHLVRQLATTRSDLQRQMQQQALLSRIGESIRGSLDLDEILTATGNELGRALQVSRCLIQLNGPSGFLPVIHQYVAPGFFPVSADPLHLSQAVAARGRAVVIDDLFSQPEWLEARVGDVRAALAAPIWASDGLLGVILLHQCLSRRHWEEDDVQFVEAVASQVAVALSHARVHSDLAARHGELQNAHQDLQAQGEELEAQRAELQAQNEELIHQGNLLAEQARQLEQALRVARTAEAAQARLIAIMEATTDFIGLADKEGHVLYLNRSAREELGIETLAETQPGAHQFFAPSFARRQLKSALRTAVEKGTWSGEGVVLGGGGREIPVSLVILLHRDPSGEPFFATIARDVSAQKLAQQALRESEERFRGAFGFAPIGMGLLNANGQWVQVNRPLCDMLGFSEEELLQRDARTLVCADDLEAALGGMERMSRGEFQSSEMEQRWVHRSGHLVWTQVNVSIVRPWAREAYYVVHVQDITERKRVEKQLIHLANYDPLTELYNRRRFQEELERQLAYANRYGTRGALLFLDLDQFKYVNDSLGHQAGDRLLKSLANLLRSLLRETDAIARLGGDEFAVLLPHVDAHQAEVVANKLLSALRNHVEIIGGRPVAITGSMGIALFPDHGQTAEELLAYADLAMYQVKGVGRNNFTLYRPDETTRLQLQSRVSGERRIREALEQNRFVLLHQPILDCRTGRVERWEALLRMRGAAGEVIPPGDFLPVAERLGLIQSIDRWVVREGIRQIAHRQPHHPTFSLEVNLSGKALNDSDLLPLIEQEIQRAGIDPGLLCLELPETVACTEQVAVRQFVGNLREIGCRFALDDFGAGLSSFSSLKDLPVDYIKIDGSFIRNLTRDAVDQHLVRTIVQMAQGLGQQTIAECVETADTLEVVRRLGLDYAQGYFVGHPAPIEPM